MVMRISKDRIDMDDKVLQKPVFKDYGETVVGGASGTNSGASYTINLNDGNVFNLILNANCTFTFSNPPATGTAGSFTLYLNQDETGSRTVTWPGAVTWIGGTEPTLLTTAGNRDALFFYTLDGGTVWTGSVAGQFPDNVGLYYGFASGIEGFTGANVTISQSGSSLIVESTSTDPMLRPPVISLDGSVYYKIFISIKRTAGSGWDGKVYYQTGGHGESASYKYDLSEPAWDGDFLLLTADMSDLTAGGTDWVTSTITRIRFDFGNSATDDFEVDYIKVTA